MIKAKSFTKIQSLQLCIVFGIFTFLSVPWLRAQETITKLTTSSLLSHQKLTLSNNNRYILGPGDGLEIELVDLPEFSGQFNIGPDGTLYLPRLRAIYVEGLTVEELRIHLAEQFRTYVLDPQVYVRPVVYRPIRVYVGGEVKRPGYYTLSGLQKTEEDLTKRSSSLVDSGLSQNLDFGSAGSSTTLSQRFLMPSAQLKASLHTQIFLKFK